VIEENETVRTRSAHRKDEEIIRNFSRKSEKIRPLGRPRRRWEDNIKTDLEVIVCEVVEWVYLAQNSV
jgi:hypothetical protein